MRHIKIRPFLPYTHVAPESALRSVHALGMPSGKADLGEFFELFEGLPEPCYIQDLRGGGVRHRAIDVKDWDVQTR